MFRSASAKAGLLAAVALAGCSASAPDEGLARAQPVFDPAVFFAGRTQGDGTLKVVFKDAQPVRVQGSGQIAPDGSLTLDQVVVRGGRPPERRQWRIRRAGSGSFAGSLSDASGPVTGDVRGNRLHLAYPMKGGVHAEQWIYLQPDGRSALNRMRITKFGMPVASLNETIRKLD